MPTLNVGVDQWLQIVITGVLVGKEREELASDEPRSRRMVGEDIYHILVVKIACMSKIRFDNVIMILWVIVRCQASHMPACKRGCPLVDVLLLVVTKTKRKQFHKLTRVIFVRGSSSAFREIEVEEHGGIAGDPQQDVVECIKSMTS